MNRLFHLLLVLAGTPDLSGQLNRMGASCWNRRDVLGIGRLSATAAAEALQLVFGSEN